MTVVVAAHDAAPFIRRAVRSALAQVPPPAEVVVCDDASTDGTAEALRGLDGPLRVVRHEVNRGEGAAKNTGVRAARTPLVALLDADDEWLPGRLAAVTEVFDRHPDVDLVTTDALLVQGQHVLGRWYDEGNPFAWDGQRVAVLQRNPVFGHVALRRAALLALGGFDESLRHATDWDCWIRLVHAGGRLHLVPEPLALYRLHGDNASADRVAMNRGQVALLEKALRDLPLTTAEQAVARATLAERRRRLAREELKAALRRVDGPVRRAALTVLRVPGQPARSRAAAVAALLAPAALRVVDRRRSRGSWTGPGGRRLVTAPASLAPAGRPDDTPDEETA